MKKGITFQTESGIYSLRFNVNSLCKLEDLLGRPLSKLGDNVGIRETRLMLYCGLTPSVSIEDCGEIMDEIITEKGVEELNNLMTKALNLAMNGSPTDAVHDTSIKKK